MVSYQACQGGRRLRATKLAQWSSTAPVGSRPSLAIFPTLTPCRSRQQPPGVLGARTALDYNLPSCGRARQTWGRVDGALDPQTRSCAAGTTQRGRATGKGQLGAAAWWQRARVLCRVDVLCRALQASVRHFTPLQGPARPPATSSSWCLGAPAPPSREQVSLAPFPARRAALSRGAPRCLATS